MILYRHIKNKVISLICCEDKVPLKIPQSNWLRAFWAISQEKDVSQVWDFFKKTANNINFSHKTNLIKINEQKPYIWPISPIFGSKKKKILTKTGFHAQPRISF